MWYENTDCLDCVRCMWLCNALVNQVRPHRLPRLCAVCSVCNIVWESRQRLSKLAVYSVCDYLVPLWIKSDCTDYPNCSCMQCVWMSGVHVNQVRLHRLSKVCAVCNVCECLVFLCVKLDYTDLQSCVLCAWCPCKANLTAQAAKAVVCV